MRLDGLWPKYKVNRPLSENEKAGKLEQSKWQDQPFSDLIANGYDSVIRLNSTYLEVVDRHYIWKGFPSLALLVFLVPPLAMITMVVFIHPKMNDLKGILATIGMLLISIVWVIAVIYVLLTEFFKWTHYPIRFNRKNRRVYIFGYDGKIRIAEWEKLFFTVRTDMKDMFKDNYIFCHVLSDDDSTVLYTFTLPIETSTKSSSKGLNQYWNFLCNYMNGDIADNVAVMRVCPPIEGRREGFVYGAYHWAQSLGEIRAFLLFTFPLVPPLALTRYLVMLTCKVPKWSTEVEEECVVDPEDTVNLSAATNPKSLLGTFRIPNKAERSAFDARRDALRAKMDAQTSKDKSKRHVVLKDLL
ncbi:DUF6708 domain-containing protein [Thorsellia anophelis]|uniref:DUF6708 domain-containing protein n=1 Tax=Thorsellia anophelis DSM 18579 TaxID=1123402 RepID=A0A1I0FI58_9GAMM|nr:DUF6708 domain-containing protein [Thorsellia anophelis]SET57214.1 hypothetical protein SAMN02583745_02756 [Thorsellia anophelis DSM 18579]